MICQRSDPEGQLAAAVSEFASDHALPVVEFLPVQNLLASDHPMQCGYDVGPFLGEADVILVVDSQVPWIQRNVQPAEDAHVIHVGADPLFSRFPVRSFRNDLAITGNPAATVAALAAALDQHGHNNSARFDEIRQRNQARRDAVREIALSGNGTPMTPAFVSRCISEAMDEDAVIFNELGAPPQFMDLVGPNRFFSPPFSGGLGWGVPAALGRRWRTGTGCRSPASAMGRTYSPIRSPVTAMELPILTIVLNNGIWNAVRRAALAVFPEGEASRLNTLPLTSLAPNPDYTQIIAASRGWSERVERAGGDGRRPAGRAGARHRRYSHGKTPSAAGTHGFLLIGREAYCQAYCQAY